MNYSGTQVCEIAMMILLFIALPKHFVYIGARFPPAQSISDTKQSFSTVVLITTSHK